MASWRAVAADVLGQGDPPKLPVDRYGLEPELYRHLAQLNALPPPPKIQGADNWRAVVEDALRLAREGWAAKALALGWSWLDLYGVGPVDSYQFEGLAVWLAGREIVLLDARSAIAADGGRRTLFTRGILGRGRSTTVTPVLLWHFGRS